jgi:hypothetical protein
MEKCPKITKQCKKEIISPWQYVCNICSDAFPHPDDTIKFINLYNQKMKRKNTK